MLFEAIPGRTALKQKFIESIKSGRIPHAQLFAGPPGSGNLAFALAYAQFLLCTERRDYDSCGQCPSCSKVSKMVHPDLHFSFPLAAGSEGSEKQTGTDGFIKLFRQFITQSPYVTYDDWEMYADMEKKKPIINVEEARRIISKLSLKSYEGSYKIMIIWLAEKMNTQAANALLKLLEEPPAFTIFILVSDEPNALLPTILSRVVRYDIPLVENNEMVLWLKSELPTIDAHSAEQIALVADGNLREALRMANEAEENYMSFFRDWMRACYGANLNLLGQYLQMFLDLNREKQKICLLYGISKFRDSLLYHFNTEALIRASEQDRDFSMKFAKVISEESCRYLIDQFEKAHYYIDRNANPRLVFMTLSYKCMLSMRKVKNAV